VILYKGFMKAILNFKGKKTLYVHLLVLLVAVFVGGYEAAHLGQDVNYDLQNYHYANPYIFLHHGDERDVAVAGVQSYENPLIDIPGYLAISHLSPRAAAGVLGMIQGLNVWLIFEIALVLFTKFKCRERYKYLIAGSLAIVSFFGGGNISEVGNTMGDNLISLLVLLALLLFLKALQNPLRAGRLSERWFRVLAFGAMGVAVGLKLTAAVFAIGLLAAGFATRGKLKQKFLEQVVHGAAFVGGLAIAGGLWFMHVFRMFENPFYPFYNGVFGSPYYPDINFVDSRWLPANTAAALSRPFDLMSWQTLASEITFKDPRLGILAGTIIGFTVVTLIIKLAKQKRFRMDWGRQTTAFWIFMLVSYFIWLEKFGYYRYLMPIELLSLVAIATLVFALIRNVAVGSVLLVIGCAYITMHTSAINWGRVGWQTTYFGVTKADFSQMNDATVLLTGYAPVGFTVPYYPESTQVIRIGSDLSSPETGTDKMQALLHQKVQSARNQHKNFFAVIADEDKKLSGSQLAAYGFKTDSCKVIPMYLRAGIPSKIRICSLDEVVRR
jgi:hypothetical protein